MSLVFLAMLMPLADAPASTGEAPPMQPTMVAEAVIYENDCPIETSRCVADPAVPEQVAVVQEPTTPESNSAHPDDDQSANEGQEEIVVMARPKNDAGDPLLAVNLTSFETIQAVDKAVIGPVALAYEEVVPGPVRSGARNFLNNLQEPIIFFNFLLQLKPGKAVETLGRFAINSTIGAAGLLDVAKKRPFNLPHRPNGFGYTLGYYGIGSGAYLYLPLIGPTTVRDLFGRGVDLLVLPVAVGKPFTQPAYSVSVTTIRGLDERALANDELIRIRSESSDQYQTIRDAYLQKRQAEIDALQGKTVPISGGFPNEVACNQPKQTIIGPGVSGSLTGFQCEKITASDALFSAGAPDEVTSKTNETQQRGKIR